ncbi:hypothetical protein HYH02_002342 [Chlamydomonas schloesseri]|uniref:Uncharacterized protein n=1 Tax=Chlamydomonas schloesseri TaxID=2026947 RepID=A0A836BAV4_9CHLO|nr:hypothetical protein HYH02_002342 [Chlamydomonas schloesseri]|eukprot:KAG2453006.1 hypothetical protein HYH02_002342 [Chlamydomonas schloesseri]
MPGRHHRSRNSPQVGPGVPVEAGEAVVEESGMVVTAEIAKAVGEGAVVRQEVGSEGTAERRGQMEAGRETDGAMVALAAGEVVGPGWEVTAVEVMAAWG